MAVDGRARRKLDAFGAAWLGCSKGAAMLVVASQNGLRGIPVAWEILQAGGTALDAVESATRVIEDALDEHTGGRSGYPNLIGEVELDASVMDGRTRRAGAVAALQGFRNPITIARGVMERLPHVLLAGDGAARFARELGHEQQDLLTPEAQQAWREGLEGHAKPGSPAAMLLDRLAAATGTDDVTSARDLVLSGLVDLASDPDHVAGTVNFIALDRSGDIASAVSTSGWAWKYPGRVGDTPVIGAGNYADNRFGAAACTGHGELAIRAALARTIVAGMAAGHAVEDACREAMLDLAELGIPWDKLTVKVVAIDANGVPCGASSQPGAQFAYQNEDSDGPETRPSVVVRPSAG